VSPSARLARIARMVSRDQAPARVPHAAALADFIGGVGPGAAHD
jgi:hypothetical protein